MTLEALSATLVSNSNLMITLNDSSANTLIKYNAAGYASVDEDILARTVSKVTVAGQYALTIVIADAE